MGSKKNIAAVCAAACLSPRTRWIQLQCGGLVGTKWSPGDKVKVSVNGKSRSYTPSKVDPERGTMDLVFFLHGRGPGSSWGASAVAGDEVGVTKPRSSVRGAKVDAAPDWAMFLGDETTLGLAAALVRALPEETKVLGAIEAALEDAVAIRNLDLPLDAAVRNGAHGEALQEWLATTCLPPGQGLVWVCGEHSSVRTLARSIKQRGGPNLKVRSKAYWKSRGASPGPAIYDTKLAAK